MKKTLLTTLLALCGFCGMSQADDLTRTTVTETTTWTFESTNAVNMTNGQFYSRSGLSFKLGSDSAVFTATPSVEGATLPDTVELTQISVITGQNKTYSNLSGYIVDSGNKVIAIADNIIASVPNNGTIALDFSNTTLSTSETYKLLYATSTQLANVSVGSTIAIDTTSNNTEVAVRLVQNSPATTADWSLYGKNGSAETDVTPYISITATHTTTQVADPSIPEPATATLGLLALAGLAARRRRK